MIDWTKLVRSLGGLRISAHLGPEFGPREEKGSLAAPVCLGLRSAVEIEAGIEHTYLSICIHTVSQVTGTAVRSLHRYAVRSFRRSMRDRDTRGKGEKTIGGRDVEAIGCDERAMTRTPGHGLILEEIDGQYR